MRKLVAQASEAAKGKVRQARKAALDQSKDLPSEDDQRRGEKKVTVMRYFLSHAAFQHKVQWADLHH